MIGMAVAALVSSLGFLLDTIPPEATYGPGAIVWGGVAGLPLVAGLVQAFKVAGFPDRWAGLLAVSLGIAGGVTFASVAGVHVTTGIIQGVTVGLGASGMWSTGKSTIGVALRRRGTGASHNDGN